MRRKVWNLVCILGFTVLACGLYLFAGNNLPQSWAMTDGGCGGYYSYPPRCSEGYYSSTLYYNGRTCYRACTKKPTSGSGCGSYYSYPPRCSEGYSSSSVTYNGLTCYTACTKTATAGCGSYYSYPPRCSEGYSTETVAYGGRICYTACAKKTIPTNTSDFCEHGYAFSTLDSASAFCSELGYLDYAQISVTTSGKYCVSCTGSSSTCQSVYGELDDQAAAIEKCGGAKYVSINKRQLTQYKQATCYSCISRDLRYEVLRCEPDTVNACETKAACEAVGGKWDSGICKKSYETYYAFCQSKGYTNERPTCPDGYDYDYISDKAFDSEGETYVWVCYSQCKWRERNSDDDFCEKYGLLADRPQCDDGYYSAGSSFLIPDDDSYHKGMCFTPCTKADGELDVELKYIITSEYEDMLAFVKIYTKAGWRYKILTDPVTPDEISDEGWKSGNSENEMTLSVDSDDGTVYIYNQTPEGDVYLSGDIAIIVPASNAIKGIVTSYDVGSEILAKYYSGESMTLEEIYELAGYNIMEPNSSRRYSVKSGIVSLGLSNQHTILKLENTSEKTLTVDPDTGLLLYTLTDAEKAALGITTEKVYVVASKPEARLSRNDDGTFVKDSEGDVVAAAKNELGTLYKIMPTDLIPTMKETVFYAINLTYLEDADYADPNTWNDLKLLSYNSEASIDTDFRFEIVRNGWDDIVKQISNYKESYEIVPLASSTTENLGTFYVDFESDVNQYEFSVYADQIALNPVLVYTDSEFVDGYGPRTVDLEYGLNVEYIKVESAKGSIRTYTLLITRLDDRSSDNTLKSLVARDVSLTPSFARYTNEYYGTVANDVSEVEIAAEKNDSSATFVEGYGSRTEELKVGENTILVKVKSETGSERIYKVIITRAGTPEPVVVDETKSSNNDLSEVTISSGNLMFEPDVTDYNLYVSNDITSILVTPTADDENATVEIIGGDDLQIGSNKIETIVTAESGETQTYTINVIRKEAGYAISTDSTLSTLNIAGEKISFDPLNYLYNVVIFSGTEELAFDLAASNSNAQIEVIGNMELSDFTTVKIKVIAEDGSYSIYDINVRVETITIGEIIAFVVCSILVTGLIVYGTITRNRKQKELKLKEKEDLIN